MLGEKIQVWHYFDEVALEEDLNSNPNREVEVFGSFVKDLEEFQTAGWKQVVLIENCLIWDLVDENEPNLNHLHCVKTEAWNLNSSRYEIVNVWKIVIWNE